MSQRDSVHEQIEEYFDVPPESFTVPAMLNIDKFLVGKTALAKIKHRDACLDLIHTVYCAQGRRKPKGNGVLNLVPLNYRRLRKAVGQYHFEEVIRFLLKSGILFTDGEYKKGEKSLSYGIAQPYCNNDPKIVERMGKLPRRKQPIVNTDTFKYWLEANFKQLKIDKQKASDRIWELAVSGDGKRDADFYRLRRRVSYYKRSVALFESRIPSRDRTAGRLHSGLVNLPTQLRVYVSHPKGRLVNMDIANAQPLFLNLIVHRFTSGANQDQTRIHLPLLNLPTHVYPTIPSLYDVSLFRELTQEGRLYKHMVEVFAEKRIRTTIGGTKLRAIERGDAKAIMFEDVLFCGLAGQQTKAVMAFRETFPTIAACLDAAKGSSHNQLAIAMQRLESHIILDCICKRIFTEHPEIFLATIHDSIVTLEEHAPLIKRVMIEEFEKNYDIVPKIETEYEFTLPVETEMIPLLRKLKASAIKGKEPAL